jgi:hypothetical protein
MTTLCVPEILNFEVDHNVSFAVLPTQRIDRADHVETIVRLSADSFISRTNDNVVIERLKC